MSCIISNNILPPNLSYEIIHIPSSINVDLYDTNFYEFGNKDENYESLCKWIKYIKALYASGTDSDLISISDEYERAKRHLDLYDFYVDDRDPGSYMLGIWAIVATFDKKEKDKLINAINNQNNILIPYEQQLITLLKSSDYFINYSLL